MHLEMNEELLFVMLFFGFRRFPASLEVPESTELPSPNAGAELEPFALLAAEASSPSLLPDPASVDIRPSFGSSWILDCRPPGETTGSVPALYRRGATDRELKVNSDSFVPALAGCGEVARGLGFGS